MFALVRPIRTVLLATVIFILAFAMAASAQTTWYVDDDADPGGDGTSWDTPFKYLQDALAVAGSGDEIRIAQGVYKPDRDGDHPDGTGNRMAAFRLLIGVALYGGYGGITEPDPDVRDIMLYQSVLSGDLNADDGSGFTNYRENSWNVVIGSGTDRSTVLDGFVIRSGNANIGLTGTPLRKCRGGGMWILTGSPTIKNCIFTENSAVFGGGLYNREGSSPLVADCFFTNNRATDPSSGSGTHGNGGAMLNAYDSHPTILRCMFAGNCAINNIPAFYGGSGGAVFSGGTCSPYLESCRFLGNSAVGFGGAILNWKGSGAAQINRCSFVGNFAEGGGGAIHTREAAGTHTIVNCLFVQNYSPVGATLQFVDQAQEVVVVNCTIVENNTADGGLHATGWGTTVELHNCIVWGNAGEQLVQDNDAQLWVTYSNIEGGWAGEGNIDTDPLFVDVADWDFHLAVASPCIDAGDNEAVSGDMFDLDEDGDTDEPIPFDLDGNPRFADDPDTDDTGNPDPDYPDLPIVDMGAYEFQGMTACPGDIDGDGDTDHADLGALLGAWDSQPGDPHWNENADLDGDGEVGHSDLGILLADWGCGT